MTLIGDLGHQPGWPLPPSSRPPCPLLQTLPRSGNDATLQVAQVLPLPADIPPHDALSAATHRSKVIRVGEEDSPLSAEPLVEVNGAVGGLGLEVGGDGA
jgi:hypothetical protein